MPRPLTIFKLLDRILLWIFKDESITNEERGSLLAALHDLIDLVQKVYSEE